MVKRAKLEIIKDILNIIRDNKNSIRVTPLLRKSGLSSSGFKEYYNELIKRGLVREVLDKNQDKFVILTENGFKFLERYKSIVEFIEEFGL
jgi:predicted transcriptional regulator